MNTCGKSLFPFFFAILAVLIAFAPPAGAGLEENYPSGTLVYAHWAGRSLVFDGSMFGRMINEQKGLEILKNILSVGAVDMNDKDRNVFTHLIRVLDISWQHPVSAGVISLDDDHTPSVLLLVDLGKDLGAFRKEMDAIMATVSKENGGIAPPTKFGRGTYQLLPDTEPAEVAVGYADSVFFLSIGKEGWAKSFLEKKPSKNIGHDKKYLDRMKVVAGKDTQLSVYIDVEGILKRVETISKKNENARDSEFDEVKKIVDSVGLGNVSAVAGTTSIVDKAMYSRIRLFSPAPHQGILMPFAGRPLTPTDLAGVPADASVVAALNLSLMEMRAEIHRVAKLIDPEAELELSDIEKAMEEEIGLSIDKDILPALGDTWVISSARSQGGLLTGTVLTVEVADEKLLAKVTGALEKKIAAFGDVLSMKSGKTDIRMVRIKEVPAPVMPAWAIHNKKLYLALWPQVIASAVENKTPDLSTAKQFKELRSRVSPRASVLTYVDAPGIARELYPLRLVLSAVMTNMIKLPAAKDTPSILLPETFAGSVKYLGHEIGAVSSDKNGITFEGWGTAPAAFIGSGGLMMVGVMTASMAVPMYRQASGDARRAMATAETHQLNAAAQMYRADKGKFPVPGVNDYRKAAQALVDAKMLDKVPVPPEGYVYSYDSEKGTFSLQSK